MISILAALQLKLALLVTIPATLRAWYSSSASVQFPGTTITGLTQPSSAVTGLVTTGSFAVLRRARSSGSSPQTMAS